MVASEITANVFPIPTKLAINIFAIPPMSTEPERVFSCARRIISWDRTRLGSQMVEYSECLKSWISIPSGKDRPLLAGVFWSAEEVDIACDDVTMHAALLRWMTNSHIAVDDAKGLGEIGRLLQTDYHACLY